MSVPREYLLVFNQLKAKYPKDDPDKLASTAAEIVRRDLAAIGADGFLHFRPEVGKLAPRLGPTPQISEAMSESQKLQVYQQIRARLSDTLPTPKPAAPTYSGEEPLEVGENLSDNAKIGNALRLAARYRSAQEIKAAQIKETNDHASEIRANAAKLGGT